jgi:hypothetical protein
MGASSLYSIFTHLVLKNHGLGKVTLCLFYGTHEMMGFWGYEIK